jgi:alkylation response protein AidB-like acyl-CoA dehydrogenase
VALPVLDVEAAAARMGVDGGALTGTLLVHGAPDFSLVAVPFTDSGDPAVALVAREDVVVEALPSIDPSVHVARVVLDAVTPARQVVARGSALHDTWRQRVCTVAALEAVGAARTALARTLDYALTRAQFGRRIGSFQAYKHRCSSAYVELKLAQSLAFRAAAEPDTPSGRALALAAGVESTRAAVFVCGEAIQLHGGIGFSWESGLHRLLKRARTAQLLAVDSDAAAADLIRTTALVSAE